MYRVPRRTILGDAWEQTHDASEKGGKSDLEYERLKIFSKWWTYIIEDSPVHGAVLAEIKDAYDCAVEASRRGPEMANTVASRPEEDQRIETELLPEKKEVAVQDGGGGGDEAEKRNEQQDQQEQQMSTGTNASLLAELARMQNMLEEKDTLIDDLQQQLLDSNPVTSTSPTSPLNRR